MPAPPRVLAGLLFLAVVTGACTPGDPAGRPPAPAVPPGAFAVVDAVLGDGGTAVLLDAGTGARVTTDAGRSWSTLHLPARPATGASIAVSGNRIDLVSVQPAGMRLQHSGDGGRHWQSAAVPLRLPTDTAQLAVSADGRRSAVLASVPGNANDGDQAQLYVRNGSGPLLARTAPASGSLAWAGSVLLLAGGPLHSRLYASSDAGISWRPLALGGPVAPRFGLDPDAAVIGAPLPGPYPTVTVPVRRQAGDGSEIQLYGNVPSEPVLRGSAVLAGRTGAGVLPVAATAGPSTTVLADPSGSTLYVLTTGAGAARMVRAGGLPGPMTALTFTDPVHGLARIDLRSCNPDKAKCSQSVRILATVDGGRTWHASG